MTTWDPLLNIDQPTARELRRAQLFNDFLASLGEPRSNVIQFPRRAGSANNAPASDQ